VQITSSLTSLGLDRADANFQMAKRLGQGAVWEMGPLCATLL